MYESLVGRRFGRLVATGEAGRNADGSILYRCKCDCGNESVVRSTDLRRLRTKSCGCMIKDVQRERLTKHGKSRSQIYHIWKCMIARCSNNNDISYLNYGGRGISVCSEWMDFESFMSWAYKSGYEDDNGLSLERIDVDKGYDSSNCTFIPKARQNRNTRKTYRYKGEPLIDYCERNGLNYHTIRHRISVYKWCVEKAVLTPIRKR